MIKKITIINPTHNTRGSLRTRFSSFPNGKTYLCVSLSEFFKLRGKMCPNHKDEPDKPGKCPECQDIIIVSPKEVEAFGPPDTKGDSLALIVDGCRIGKDKKYRIKDTTRLKNLKLDCNRRYKSIMGNLAQ